MDYRGNLCGGHGDMKEIKWKWDPNYNYVTPDSNGELVPSDLGICVDSCKFLIMCSVKCYA